MENFRFILKLVIENWFSWPGALITVALVLAFTKSDWIIDWARRRVERREPRDEAQEKPQPRESRSEEPPASKEDEITVPAVQDDTTEEGSRREMKLFVNMQQEQDLNKLKQHHESLKSLPERDFDDEFIDTMYYDRRLHLGDERALHQLLELEDSKKEWHFPSVRLAIFYKQLGDLDAAISHIEKAIARPHSDEKALTSWKFIRANILFEQGKPDQAFERLYEIAETYDDNEIKARAYDKIADLYQKKEDNTRMQFALEQSLKLEPQNNSRRFRLAYLYSEDEHMNPLSIYHYSILSRIDESYGSTLNNLGVQLGTYGLNIERVRLWKRALIADVVYPAGNLAVVYADAGFVEEGRQQLDNLSEADQKERRPLEARQHIDQLERKEEKKKDKVEILSRTWYTAIESAVDKWVRKDWQNIGNSDIEGEWRSENGESLTLHFDSKDEFTGSITSETNQHSVNARRVDTIVIVKAKHRKTLTGAGLLGIGSLAVPGGKDHWMEPVFKNDYRMWLVIEDSANLAGIREFDKLTVDKVTFRKT